MSMEELFFKALSTLSWPGAVALVAYLLYKALPYFVDLKDSRVNDLVTFKNTAENNHFTDLDRLLKSDEEQWKVINGMRDDLIQQGRDIAYIKGKIGNGKP